MLDVIEHQIRIYIFHSLANPQEIENRIKGFLNWIFPGNSRPTKEIKINIHIHCLIVRLLKTENPCETLTTLFIIIKFATLID